MSWLSGDLHTHCLSPTRCLHYFKLQISQSGVRTASHSCVCWAAELWVSREMFLAIYREMSNWGASPLGQNIFVSHWNTMIHTINKTNKQKTPSQLLLSRAEGLGFVVKPLGSIGVLSSVFSDLNYVNSSWRPQSRLAARFLKQMLPLLPRPCRVTCSSFPLWNRTVKQHKVTSFSSGQCQRTQGLLSL